MPSRRMQLVGPYLNEPFWRTTTNEAKTRCLCVSPHASIICHYIQEAKCIINTSTLPVNGTTITGSGKGLTYILTSGVLFDSF